MHTQGGAEGLAAEPGDPGTDAGERDEDGEEPDALDEDDDLGSL
jgi:hypothetical protein